MRSTTILLIAVPAAILLACGARTADTASAADTTSAAAAPQPANNVTLTPLATSIRAGGVIQFRLVNGGGRNIGYNLCSGGMLERRDGNAWAEAPDTGRVCTMELRILKGRDSTTEKYTVSDRTAAGEYRLRAIFGNPAQAGVADTVRSGGFSVTR